MQSAICETIHSFKMHEVERVNQSNVQCAILMDNSPSRFIHKARIVFIFFRHATLYIFRKRERVKTIHT
jgi:hypothetical protein